MKKKILTFVIVILVIFLVFIGKYLWYGFGQNIGAGILGIVLARWWLFENEFLPITKNSI